MNKSNQLVTKKVPHVLKNLILANNALLQQYRDELLHQIEEASTELLQIMGLDNSTWKLDVEGMQFVRPATEDEIIKDDIRDDEYGTIS
jgi:hypothetical protein